MRSLTNLFGSAAAVLGTPGTLFYISNLSKEQNRALEKLPDADKKENFAKATFLREKYKDFDFDGQPLLRRSLQDGFCTSAEEREEFLQWKLNR